MKNFYDKHPETILATLGLCAFVAIIVLYGWGIGDLATTLNQALNYSPSQSSVGFNLETAAALDWRGLVK